MLALLHHTTLAILTKPLIIGGKIYRTLMEQLKLLLKYGLSHKRMASIFLTLKLSLVNLESLQLGSLPVMNMQASMMFQFMTGLTMNGQTELRTLLHQPPQLSLNELTFMIRIKHIIEPYIKL